MKQLAFWGGAFLSLSLALAFGGWSAFLWVLFLLVLPALVLFLSLSGVLPAPKPKPKPALPLTFQERLTQGPHLTMADLLHLSPGDFEEFISLVVEAMGLDYHHVQRVGGSGDVGIDIYALSTFHLPVVIQCKRYQENILIDSPTIQQFLGSITYRGAIYGWFITTSDYTFPARSVAQASNRIRLLNGEQLLTFINGRKSEILAAWTRKQSGITS
jgi:hypothetical protein